MNELATRILIIGSSLILFGVIAISSYIARRFAHPRVRSFEMAKAIELERTPDLFEEYLAWPKESYRIKSKFGYELQCYHIPNPQPVDPVFRRFVIIAHGYRHTHYGGIKYASMMRSFGYDVVLFDERHHGSSGGKNTTLGACESHDLQRVIHDAYARFGSSIQVGLYGESMGAAVVLLAQAREERIKFVISDCSFSDLTRLAAHQIHTLHKLPLWPFLATSSFVFRLMTGTFYGEISPLSAVEAARAPILFIHGEADRFIPKEHSERLYQACRSPKRLKLFADSRHAESFRKHRIDYRIEVERFLTDLVTFAPLNGKDDDLTGGTRDV
jgi:uncharacterized protein